MNRSTRILAALLFGVTTACALTGKGTALAPRYFTPELVAPQRSARASEQLELRLGQVSSAAHLDERISYRLTGSELGFYEDRRWTEPPEAYLRRALERELFEDRRLSRIVTGSAPTLEVELTAFEELRGRPTRARITLTFTLRDDRRALVQRSLDLVRPLDGSASGDATQQLTQGLAATLAEAVQSIGDEVVQSLQATRRETSSP